jgi:hypothetical protein
MPIVQKTNGKTVKVKNLGWLLKHWKEVDYFNLYRFGNFPKNEGLMIAKMKAGSGYLSYRTEWASYDLMSEWLKRPVFDGIEINIL